MVVPIVTGPQKHNGPMVSHRADLLFEAQADLSPADEASPTSTRVGSDGSSRLSQIHHITFGQNQAAVSITTRGDIPKPVQGKENMAR
jgi:hypothetical protein